MDDFLSAYFCDGKKIEEKKSFLNLAGKKDILRYTDTFTIFKVESNDTKKDLKIRSQTKLYN
jgi:hypothetical protein